MTERVPVRKTYKLFVGGKFPRSESGRSFSPPGLPHCNVARASRKDLRDAVVAARKGLAAWSGLSAYLRGQILYRIAEVMETRAASLAEELAQGADRGAAEAEVAAAIDVVTWYAGIPDKLQSLLGSQNAVSGPFFNFTTVEPTGVIGVIGPERPGLLGCVALIAPLLAGGNSVIALAGEAAAPACLALGEVLAVSDVPAGAVNLLAGHRTELESQFASHRDVDGLLIAGPPGAEVGRAAADSVKRVRYADLGDDAWRAEGSLLWVEPFVEVKTFWHPVAR